MIYFVIVVFLVYSYGLYKDYQEEKRSKIESDVLDMIKKYCNK